MGKMDRVNRRINRTLSKEFPSSSKCVEEPTELTLTEQTVSSPTLSSPLVDEERTALYMETFNLRNERDILRAELNLKTTALSYEGLRNNKDKKQKFPRLTSIIDCFEIFIEAPSNFLARGQCYSQYKKHCTIKVFISRTPLGAVNFISSCYGGRASDVQIVRESDFTTTKYHHPGDQILADRGFTLKEDFALNSASELLIPAFTKGKKQLSAEEIESTRKIASVRIHIERVIGLIKNRYIILKGIMPIRCVKSMKDEKLDETLANCDKIVMVCAALCNLSDSIVHRK